MIRHPIAKEFEYFRDGPLAIFDLQAANLLAEVKEPGILVFAEAIIDAEITYFIKESPVQSFRSTFRRSHLRPSRVRGGP